MTEINDYRLTGWYAIYGGIVDIIGNGLILFLKIVGIILYTAPIAGAFVPFFAYKIMVIGIHSKKGVDESERNKSVDRLKSIAIIATILQVIFSFPLYNAINQLSN